MSDYYRQLNFYIDATVPEWYIESEDGAALLAANVKNISFGELVRASFQLTEGEPVFNSSGVLQNPWTAFAGSAAVSEVVVDNNFNWWDDCRLQTALTAGTAVGTIQISNLSAVPRALGSIRLSASDIVHYNAYSVSNGVYTFTLADESFETDDFTPEGSYAAGDAVRIIEMPVIVSAENSGTPATGLFAGTLDAANPVYEALIEGNSSISGTQLELSIFVSGRAVFRSRVLFDCLSALNPGEGTAWIRPNVWAAADARYIQYANLSTTATALTAGSNPTATVTVTGEAVNINFGIPAGAQGAPGPEGPEGPEGPAGADGSDGVSPYIGANGNWYDANGDTGVKAELSGSYVAFSAVDSSGNYTLAGTTTVPYAVLTNAGNFYPVEKGSVTVNTTLNTVTLNVAPYLAYDDSPSFTGTWRIYFSAGSATVNFNGLPYVALTGAASVTIPAGGSAYTLTIGQDTTITFPSPGNATCYFWLYLTTGATIYSVTLPNSIDWEDGIGPDLSTVSSLYRLAFLWDAPNQKWLGSLFWPAEVLT